MRAATIALAAAMIGVGTAACSSIGDDGVTYSPAAYYQRIHGVDECYYVDDVTEVANLIYAGLCPRDAIAVQMPLAWEEEYWPYYSSTSYIDTYIPSNRRTHFTSVTVVTFSTRYKTQISTQSKKAVYKGSNGTTTTGSSAKKFTGSGSGTGAVHGGGGARGCSVSMHELADKSSSSHGGGSSRTGTSTAKTRTKSGSGSNGAC